MIKKGTCCLLFVLIGTVLTSFNYKRTVPPAPPQKSVIKTIILDAGHGGRDVGAHGDYSYEKDIALGILLQLGKKLEAEFPEIKVLYTRTTDEYPSIKSRADFANSNKGDLFVSIHVDARSPIKHSKFAGYKTETYYTGKGKSRKKRTRKVPKYNVYYTDDPANGTSTYIWAADRADAKGEFVTERISDEVNDSTEYVPDINDPEFKAKSLLWTKRFFEKSLLLATLVEEEFINGGRVSQGVKQRNEKGIWVLQATAMPSILVETGFISYRPEEDYLNSKKGQEAVADGVLNAIKRYKAATEGLSTSPK